MEKKLVSLRQQNLYSSLLQSCGQIYQSEVVQALLQNHLAWNFSPPKMILELGLVGLDTPKLVPIMDLPLLPKVDLSSIFIYSTGEHGANLNRV